MGKHGKHKDRKQEKERMKMMETADEKQKRRAEKKARKAAKRKQDETVAGYSNDANPFGDTQLSEKFVWKKKVQSDARAGVYHEKTSKADEKRRREEIGDEIAKVKKRRQEREDEREAWEAEKERMQRDANEAEYGDYAAQEEKFHLRQTRVRSQIRIREGRAKAIDRVQRNLSSVGTDDFDIEVPEPHFIFPGLSLYEIEEVRDDIKVNQEFDKENAEFWACMMTVCDDEHTERKQKEDKGGAYGQQQGLHSSIDGDIQKVLRGKSGQQLEDMEKSIESKINSGDSVDVEYWETLLSKLKVQKAKAKLREFHSQLLRSHLNALEEAEAKDFFGRDHVLRYVTARHAACAALSVLPSVHRLASVCVAAAQRSTLLLCRCAHAIDRCRPEGEEGSMGQDWDEDPESLINQSADGSAAAAAEQEASNAAAAEDDDGSFSPELFDEDEVRPCPFLCNECMIR
jgi:hypothetical protein